MSIVYEEALSNLKNVSRSDANKAVALCPAHADKNPSLSITKGRNGNALFKCFAGCDYRDVLGAMGGGGNNFNNGSSLIHKPKKQAKAKGLGEEKVSAGLTLEQLSTFKQIPIDVLTSFGLSEISYTSNKAVKIPYCNEEGQEVAVRFRFSTDGKNKFKWRTGDKPVLYGLDRLGYTKEVTLVEGESDCWTLWNYGFPALGVAGNSNWNEQRDSKYFASVKKVYVIIENGKSGEGTLRWLQESEIRHKSHLVYLDEADDPSGLHLQPVGFFPEDFQKALDSAMPFSEWEKRKENDAALENQRVADEALQNCKELAYSKDIFSEFDKKVSETGFVGDNVIVRGIFIALLSRLTDKPISVLVKGPSGGSKSFSVGVALEFFRQGEDYYDLTCISDKALQNYEDAVEHKFIVMFEGGYESQILSTALRTLISEGVVRYMVSVKDPETERWRSEIKELKGPTGYMSTTTKGLNPENENRCLIFNTDDGAELTNKIVDKVFERAFDHKKEQAVKEISFDDWHNLQTVLKVAPKYVDIPYANALKKLLGKKHPLRMRRDVNHIVQFINCHAMLHFKTRKVIDGAIQATIADYRAIYPIVCKPIAESIGVSTSEDMIATVEALRELTLIKEDGVSASAVGKKLGLERTTASYRLNQAKKKGLVENTARRGKEGKWVVADEHASTSSYLPTPEQVEQCLYENTIEHDPTPP